MFFKINIVVSDTQTGPEREMLKKFKDTPILLVINKIDLLSEEEIKKKMIPFCKGQFTIYIDKTIPIHKRTLQQMMQPFFWIQEL